MPNAAYRFMAPITVVLRDPERQRLVELPGGSIFVTTASAPDCNGMIDGTCNGTSALLFARDLDERAERVEMASEASA